MVQSTAEALDLKTGLARAETQEAEYNWLGAVGTYRELSDSQFFKGSSTYGELQERMGRAWYRAAMQADSGTSFKERICEAVSAFEEATKCYGKLGDGAKAARCRARIPYLNYWLTPNASQKKKLLGEAWALAKESLDAFRTSRDGLEFARTYAELSPVATLAEYLEFDYESSPRLVREAAKLGEEATRLITNENNPPIIAVCVIASHFMNWLADRVDQEEGENYRRTGNHLWQKALQLSERTALYEAAEPFLSWVPFDWSWEKTVEFMETELEHRRKTRDRLSIGWVLVWLSEVTYRISYRTEDPNEKLKLVNLSYNYAKEAEHEFSASSFTCPTIGFFMFAASELVYYFSLSSLETDIEKRRHLLKKTLEVSIRSLTTPEVSVYPTGLGQVHHYTSKVLAALAPLEPEPGKRKGMLLKAMEHRIATAKNGGQAERAKGGILWDFGVQKNYTADLKSQLAEFARGAESRKKILTEAIQDKDTALKLCEKSIEFMQRTGPVPDLDTLVAKWQSEHGSLLNRLHQLTGDRGVLRTSRVAFLKAAELFKKPNHLSRVAECYWQAAMASENLEEHLKAGELFLAASNSYSLATDKIPHLKDLYNDHALYMEAWSNIENARYHHGRQEYSSAKEYYEAASKLHGSTTRWKFLVPNYSAWAELENAEDLSRRDKSQEATQVFGRAVALFGNVGKSILDELGRVVDPVEKEIAVRLAKASDQREQYCRARIVLEEGKALNRQGDRQSSSQKYKQAAALFEKMASSSDSGAALHEFMLVATVSKAWQAMTEAEASDSPSLYLGASRLFEKAKQFSPTESTTMLVSGHSHFCRALEAGAKFVNTREAPFHASAMGHLESAALHYLKAGYHDASEYAKATGLLFDAYLQMDMAKKEGDPERKAKLYMMTEKLLQAAADSYSNAQYPGKNREVLELLDKVTQDREMTQSLLEILHSPSVAAATQLFNIPFPTLDVPHGLEEFEHADIQARLITQQSGVMIGDILELKISLVNAGRGPAQIVRIEDAIPENFDLLEEKPDVYAVETRHLHLKGRKLDPLKFVEVKLTLKPRIAGPAELKPRIVYLDEMGKSRVCEVEGLDLAVGDPSLRAGAVVTMLLPSSREVFVGDDVPIAFQIASVGGRPVTLVSFENVAPIGLVPVSAIGGLLARRESLELSDLKLEPLRTHRISLVLKATGDGKIAFAPSLVYRDEIEGVRQEVVPASEIMIHPSSPILEFIIQAFANDYVTRRLSFERAGWRSLMEIVRGLKIPRSHAYGESRYGHTFGKPLETLVRTGLVEYRRFPGKGRGGEALKVRARYERDFVRRRVEATALHRLEGA